MHQEKHTNHTDAGYPSGFKPAPSILNKQVGNDTSDKNIQENSQVGPNSPTKDTGPKKGVDPSGPAASYPT
ncbi:hypothetical protein OPQ81_001206 [Rhizoctonia solani]|nr:hypothetical protein OPQ81_001206 [Rhizoctonia solani]